MAAAAAPPPSIEDDYWGTRAAYNGKGADYLKERGWVPVRETKTLRAWVRGSDVLVSLRGTKGAQDIRADIALAFNLLTTSQRYKADVKQVHELLQEYPHPPYHYFLVAHSLGGAIAMEVQRNVPRLRDSDGVFFNGAIPLRDLLNQDPRDEEIYIDTDPLLKLIGHKWRYKRVLHPAEKLPATKAHKLSAFTGLLGGGGHAAGGGSSVAARVAERRRSPSPRRRG